MSKIRSHPAATILGPATPTNRASGWMARTARMREAPWTSALGSAPLIKTSGSRTFLGSCTLRPGRRCLARSVTPAAPTASVGAGIDRRRRYGPRVVASSTPVLRHPHRGHNFLSEIDLRSPRGSPRAVIVWRVAGSRRPKGVWSQPLEVRPRLVPHGAAYRVAWCHARVSEPPGRLTAKPPGYRG
jgi:hypothetical protein